MSDLKLELVRFEPVEGVNLIIGQAHFIKTVEDLYEQLASSSPTTRFGLAFCESSGPALIRYDGNDEELTRLAVEYARRLSAGHIFIILLKEAYPINVLNRVKQVEEVVTLFCATANPVEVVVAETGQGRGVLGVIDGVASKGVEGEKEKGERRELLRRLGYKR
jgi:hypothetical protein